MPFWFVSLPLLEVRRDRTWEVLQETTTSLSTNNKFDIPELRVGTLDTLMQLSDELAKTNNLIEAVVNKLRRQVSDLGGVDALHALRVAGVPVEAYLGRFKWNDARYQAKRPLKELAEVIVESVARVEDDLKVKLTDYNTLKQQLSAVARKASGSLAVRDIGRLVKPQHVVDSENMTTVFVVVSRHGLKEWESSYETLCNFVVPRSSKVIAEDNDYALVTVVLFRRVVDEFKTACRTKGYQVRDYKPPAEDDSQLSEAQVKQLEKDVANKRAALEGWSKTAFEEAFTCWAHLMAIRMFVESILRYGLPPAYQAAMIMPVDKKESQLRKSLGATFGGGKADLWVDEGGSGSAMAGLAGEELFPYVSFTMNIDFA